MTQKEQERFFFSQLPSQKSWGNSRDLKEYCFPPLGGNSVLKLRRTHWMQCLHVLSHHDTTISDLVTEKLKHSLIPNFLLLSCKQLADIKKPTWGICSNPWLNKGLFTKYTPATAVMMTKETLSCSSILKGWNCKILLPLKQALKTTWSCTSKKLKVQLEQLCMLCLFMKILSKLSLNIWILKICSNIQIMQVPQGGFHMTLQQWPLTSADCTCNGSMDPPKLDQGQREEKEE